jgi:hypothetical protein
VTDEEAQNLTEAHRRKTLEAIEEVMKSSREKKEEKMSEVCDMLTRLTKSRDAREDRHRQERQERQELENKLRQDKEKKEEEQFLVFAARREKQRADRLHEVEGMEEHERQIAARNVYLAVNRDARQVKAFESWEDGQVRTAASRQREKTKERSRPLRGKNMAKGEFAGLRGMLGLDTME